MKNIADYMIFHRVAYKTNTSAEFREYRLGGITQSPVGTKAEIKKWFKDMKLKKRFRGIILVDKGKITEIIEM